MPPPHSTEPRALPAPAAAHAVAGREPPSRQGAVSGERPGSSANSLSFEIEFGSGEGWLGPAPPAWAGSRLPDLPSSENTGQGLGWLGQGPLSEAGRGRLVKRMEGHCQRRECTQLQHGHGTSSGVAARTLSTLFPGPPTRKSGGSNFGGHYRHWQLYPPNKEAFLWNQSHVLAGGRWCHGGRAGAELAPQWVL